MLNTPQIILGLGNPGEEYANTYHNVGFLAIDYFCDTLGGPDFKKEQGFEFVRTNSVTLAKSNTFMNESGKTARAALKKFNATPSELLVIHDDSDIMLGNYKLSFDRSAAGHNGVQSIIDALGTKQFHRLRIGIRSSSKRKPFDKAQNKRGRLKAGDFVLKKISSGNKKILNDVFSRTFSEIFPTRSTLIPSLPCPN